MFNTFKRVVGGIHPRDDGKQLTRQAVIEPLTQIPAYLYIQLKQHPGSPAIPIVKNNQSVYAGEMIAQANGRFCAPLHAPLYGQIIAIDEQKITLKPDRIQPPLLIPPTERLEPNNRVQLLDKLEHAGIVGMGGAMFPLFDKLAMSKRYQVTTLLINGSECEPYMTCDDRVMREQAEQIIGGIRFLLTITQAEEAIIGIEKNKPEAIASLTHAASEDHNIIVKALPALYPLGSSKQLIRALTGIQLAPGRRSASYGLLVHNVASCVAVFEALRFNHPMTHRVVTISGHAITNPKNIYAPIGTPISQLINQCGGLTTSPAQQIMGGPMMGKVITHIHQGIVKGTSGILMLDEHESRINVPTSCLRCGRCAKVCPMQLQPLHLLPLVQHEQFADAEKMGLKQCISCGACAYVCPSMLPLTASFNWGKNELKQQDYLAHKLAKAREHTNAHQQRLLAMAEAKKAAKAMKSAKRKGRQRQSHKETTQ